MTETEMTGAEATKAAVAGPVMAGRVAPGPVVAGGAANGQGVAGQGVAGQGVAGQGAGAIAAGPAPARTVRGQRRRTARPLRAQVVTETVMTLRRGESLLLTLGIPVGLLAFLSLTKVLPGPSHRAGFLVPGVLALAIMSTGMVSLGIATAFEREYQVLKRLGATPLGRPRLVIAKVLSVALVELLQAGAVVAVGFGVGWAAGGSHVGGTTGGPLLALVAAVAATSAFGGIGLLMAGRLRADVVLALANGLWLVLMLLGGMLFPLTKLPGALRAIADVLPAAALAQALRGTIGSAAGVPLHAWIVLGIWAVAAPLLAAWAFRWE